MFWKVAAELVELHYFQFHLNQSTLKLNCCCTRIVQIIFKFGSTESTLASPSSASTAVDKSAVVYSDRLDRYQNHLRYRCLPWLLIPFSDWLISCCCLNLELKINTSAFDHQNMHLQKILLQLINYLRRWCNLDWVNATLLISPSICAKLSVNCCVIIYDCPTDNVLFISHQNVGPLHSRMLYFDKIEARFHFLSPSRNETLWAKLSPLQSWHYLIIELYTVSI